MAITHGSISEAIASTPATAPKCCKLTDTKALLLHSSASVDWRPKVAVANLSGTTISSWGAAQDVNTSYCDAHDVAQLDEGKAVIAYRDSSNYLHCVVASISGSAVTINTPTIVVAATNCAGPRLCVIDRTHFLLTYVDNDSYTYACLDAKVGTINGTSISFGPATTVLGYDNDGDAQVVQLSSTAYFLFGNWYGAENRGYGTIVNVDSSYAITANTIYNWAASGSYSNIDQWKASKIDSTHVLCVAQATVDSTTKAAVATISGTSISWNAATTIYATPIYASIQMFGADKALIVYNQDSSTDELYAGKLTIDGSYNVSTISGALEVSSDGCGWNNITLIDSDQALVVFANLSENTYPYGVMIDAGMIPGIYAPQTNYAKDYLVYDQLSAAHRTSWGYAGDTEFGRGQTFMTGSPSPGLALGVRFYIFKNNEPTLSQTVTANLYAHSGTFGTDGEPVGGPLASSMPWLVADLPTTAQWVSFYFIEPYLLAANTAYCLELHNTADTTGEYVFGYNNTGTVHPGNYVYYSGGFGNESSRDSIFQLLTAPCEISFTTPQTFSGTDPVDSESACLVRLTASTVLAIWRENTNSDGHASVGTISSSGISWGTTNDIFTDATIQFPAACLLEPNKVLLTYRDTTNSNYGKACILTVSGDTVTINTIYTFHSGNTISPRLAALSHLYAVVAFQDAANDDTGAAIVLGISGTTITFGEKYPFGREEETTSLWVCALDSTRFAVTMYGIGTNVGRLQIGQITPATKAIDFFAYSGFHYSGPSVDETRCEILDESKILVTFRENAANNNVGKAIVATYDGVSVTGWGREAAYNSAETNWSNLAIITPKKFMIAFQDGVDSDYGKCILGQVKDNNEIVFSSEQVFNNGIFSEPKGLVLLKTGQLCAIFNITSSSGIGRGVVVSLDEAGHHSTLSAAGAQFSISGIGSYDCARLDSTHLLFAYRASSSPNAGRAVIGTISSGTVSFGSYFEWSGGTAVSYIRTLTLEDNKVLIVYLDSSGYGTCIVATVSGSTISYGSPASFSSETTTGIFAEILDTNKAIITLRLSTTANVSAVIATVSETTVSYGAVYPYATSNIYITGVTVLSPTKAVVAYSTTNSAYLIYFYIATISGTNISYGSATTLAIENNEFFRMTTFNDETFMVGLDILSDGKYEVLCIGSVAMDAIVFGDPFPCDQLTDGPNPFYSTPIALDETKFVVSYQFSNNQLPVNNTRDLHVTCGTRVGKTIVLGARLSWDNHNLSYLDWTYFFRLSSTQLVIFYRASSTVYGMIIDLIDEPQITAEQDDTDINLTWNWN